MKKEKMILVGIILVLPTLGCVRSSGVLKMAPDTYNLTTNGPAESAKKQAYLEAANSCEASGKDIYVMKENMKIRNAFGDATFELIFRCLAKDDPEMQIRPIYRKDPDVLIEDQRK